VSESPEPVRGLAWLDLTVPDAESLKDFYAAVTGWTLFPVPMGDYSDYALMDGETTVAGVCHARGPNADIPPVWMPYFRVDDIEAAAAKVVELGGELLRQPSEVADYGRTCYIRDPAGVVCGLFQPSA
jgi:predicted enzyme related to lactoylglutathione lyase